MPLCGDSKNGHILDAPHDPERMTWTADSHLRGQRDSYRMLKEHFETAGVTMLSEVEGIKDERAVSTIVKTNHKKPFQLFGLTPDDPIQEGDEYSDHYFAWHPILIDKIGVAAKESNFVAVRRKGISGEHY